MRKSVQLNTIVYNPSDEYEFCDPEIDSDVEVIMSIKSADVDLNTGNISKEILLEATKNAHDSFIATIKGRGIKVTRIKKVDNQAFVNKHFPRR